MGRGGIVRKRRLGGGLEGLGREGARGGLVPPPISRKFLKTHLDDA
jgi:hypothetical protein